MRRATRLLLALVLGVGFLPLASGCSGESAVKEGGQVENAPPPPPNVMTSDSMRKSGSN
jgi:hypothetical protein